MKQRIEVDADALYQVLSALNGPIHLVEELRYIRNLPPTVVGGVNPINQLVEDYNTWMKYNEGKNLSPGK